MTFCIGITGGIASGKSTFASFLSAYGDWPLIDADHIARSLTTASGLAMHAIAETFPQEYISPDGSLNRGKMRQLIFSDHSQKIKLESILHPLIRQEFKFKIQSFCDSNSILLLDIPLLIDNTHWQKIIHSTILIDCEKSTQINRIQKRSNLSLDEATAIVDAQSQRFDRQYASDFIVANNKKTTLEALEKIAKYIKKILENQFGNHNNPQLTS